MKSVTYGYTSSTDEGIFAFIFEATRGSEFLFSNGARMFGGIGRGWRVPVRAGIEGAIRRPITYSAPNAIGRSRLRVRCG